MKKYNIAWIIVDSVRNYHSHDDRSKLKIMDKLAEKGIEFENVVTSAPSTVMSISSMMTSIPAYFIGRNYNDFRFDNKFFVSLSNILKNHGWTSRALLMHPDIREKLTVFDLVEKKFWPKSFSHRDWWDNSKIFELLKNTLKIDGNSKPDKPIFWFLDFNCRKDAQTSNIVENSIKLFNQYGYNKENTIFILCSDHGYPDPNTGITPEYLKKNKLTHDMFMTDDNIMIPLIMTFPGCKEGIKIDSLCSSLDIMPTILDLLEINIETNIKDKWHGKSLINLINSEKLDNLERRRVRVDARFLGQKDRVTAIREQKYKLVVYHDQKQFELFKIEPKPKIENKISINDNDELYKSLLTEFNNIENSAIELQIKYTIYKIEEKFKNLDSVKKILIINNQVSTLKDILREALVKIFPNSIIEIKTVIDLNNQNNFNENCDLLFVLDNNSNVLSKKFLKKIKYRKMFFVDINMNISIKTGMVWRFFKTIYYNRKFYFQEPTLIIWKVLKSIKLIYKKII